MLELKTIHRDAKGIYVEFTPLCTLNRIINCYTLQELNILIKELDFLMSCNDTEPIMDNFSFIDFSYGENQPKVYLNLYDPSDIWRADIESVLNYIFTFIRIVITSSLYFFNICPPYVRRVI